MFDHLALVRMLVVFSPSSALLRPCKRGIEDTLKRGKRGMEDTLTHDAGGRGEAKGEWRTLGLSSAVLDAK